MKSRAAYFNLALLLTILLLAGWLEHLPPTF
jgi:hypothetical protein